MLSALVVSSLLGASPAPGPDLGAAIREVRRAFIEDGEDRVSATATHRVISRPDGSLVLQGAQSLRISLQSVRREQGSPCLATARARAAQGSTVRTSRRCAVEESWTNTAEGLEHELTVRSAPRGAGGLVVRLAVEGPWHHQDAEGHLFHGPGGAAPLRYGNAFVVRDGRRLPIPVVHVEGGLELRVPRALLEAPGAFPLHIDPLVSSEVALDPMGMDRGLLTGSEQQPALAVDDNGRALVVWADDRRQLETDIFAARFERGQGLVDPVGFPVMEAPGHQRHPAVAWDGTAFLVAWELGLPDGGGEVWGRGVSSAGVPGPPPVALATPGTEPALSGVPFSLDGGYSVLVWVEAAQVKAASFRGTIRLTTWPPPNIMAGGGATRPAVAASARGSLVVWERPGVGVARPSIHGWWLGSNLELQLSPDGGPEARNPVAMVVPTSTDADGLVYWDEGLLSVGGARVKGLQVTPAPSYPGSGPALARAEGTSGVILGFSAPLGALHLKDLDGGTTLILNTPGPRAQFALAGGGGNLFGVWTKDLDLGGDVMGAAIQLPVQAGTTNFPPVPLSVAGTAQLGPNVALQGPVGLAVWRDGAGTIRGARVEVSAAGVRFTLPFDLVVQPQPIEQLDVAAGPPGLFLVTWRQADRFGTGSAVFAQLATPGGPMGSVRGLSSQAVAGPAVAWDESNAHFVVAWIDRVLAARQVVAVAVDPLGVPGGLVPVSLIEPATEVDVACLKTGACLYAWETRGPMSRHLSYVVPAANPGIMEIAEAGQPAVTHDGTRFVMGWRTANGFSFAAIDPGTGALTPLPAGLATSSASLLSRLSLAPGRPPVASWAEQVGELSSVTVQQLGSNPASFAEGQLPVVATNELPGPQGVVVYQRYDSAQAHSVQAYGVSVAFDGGSLFPELDAGVVDAGVDAGSPVDAGSAVDAGSTVDAGVDAGGPAAADAGPMTFSTSGCSCDASSTVPLLLLSLLALRRRR